MLLRLTAQKAKTVSALLGSGRLVTLIGAGGVGKTRLALAAADGLREGYPDGAWLVELAPVADPDMIPKAVASAVQVHEQPERQLLETLADALRSRTLLLVLDNCEHLLAACAQLTDRLLRAYPRLRVLATSRQALRVEGEVIWRVDSLSLPVRAAAPLTPEHLISSEAVRLFVERARSAQLGFVITPTNAHLIGEVCVGLDGIPLAIELAAMRVPALGSEQLVARLNDRQVTCFGGGRRVGVSPLPIVGNGSSVCLGEAARRG